MTHYLTADSRMQPYLMFPRFLMELEIPDTAKLLYMLLLDRAHLQIKTEGDALILYEAGERTGTLPIKLIDRCIIP